MLLKLSRVLLVAFFFMLTIGADFPTIPHSGTQADPMLVYASPTASMAFSDLYTVKNITIVMVDIEILSDTGTPVTFWSVSDGWSLIGGEFKIPIRSYASTLSNGVFQLRAKVWDQYGNSSDWSDSIWVSKQWRSIDRPGGCRTIP